LSVPIWTLMVGGARDAASFCDPPEIAQLPEIQHDRPFQSAVFLDQSTINNLLFLMINWAHIPHMRSNPRMAKGTGRNRRRAD